MGLGTGAGQKVYRVNQMGVGWGGVKIETVSPSGEFSLLATGIRFVRCY